MMNLDKLLIKLKKHWFSILFYALLAVLIFSPAAKSWVLQQVVATGLFKADIKEIPAGEEMNVASFMYKDENGELMSTEALKGKVVFINFWASWCPPCRAEMPDLYNLYQKFKGDERFVFLFINEDEDQEMAKEYLEKNHFLLPLSYRSGSLPPEVYTGTLPTTVVLNKKGEIVLKHTGMAAYNNEKFIAQLKALL